MKKYTIDNLSRFIDHTNLKPFASNADMKRLCDEAREYHFKMVAINQVQSKICAEYLKGTDINVGAAIAFPLGQTSIDAKIFETKNAIDIGANEIDYVINIAELKNKNYDYLREEMLRIVDVCRETNTISKVIFENCYLEKEEIIKMAEIAKEVEPDFIKTSTGFGPTGATLEDVKLMKEAGGSKVKVKAAGGIRDMETFIAMIRIGAERIGTSSGITIINDLRAKLQSEGKEYLEI